MRALSHLLLHHRRRSAALAAGIAAAVALAALAVAVHPGGGAGRRATGVAVAGTGTVRTAGTPAAPPSGLRLLHRHLSLHDASGAHPGAPPVAAATGLVVDADSSTILWAKDARQSRPPASTAKIVAALVALENLQPAQPVTVTADALRQAPDETRMGIQAGDVYTVTELLQAMLLVSANDAAMALGIDTVGLDRFVRAMNEQVGALGLEDSHFVTPVGLDDPGNRASAYDLAVVGLVEYDSFPLFRQIVGTRDLDVPATDGHIAYHLHNISGIMRAYPPALGIKPGWTGDAGYCLVAVAERDGHRLLVVVMDDPKMVGDARSLFEWGFGQLGVAPLPTPTPQPQPSPHR